MNLRWIGFALATLSLYALAAGILQAQPVTFNFATPVVLSNTEAPGVWYPDRFPIPPTYTELSTFGSPFVAPNGLPNTLDEHIAGGDLQTCTPTPCGNFTTHKGGSSTYLQQALP